MGLYPVFRVSVGSGLHFPPDRSVRPAFDLDISAGLGLNLRNKGFVRNDLLFEVSYSYSSEPTFGGHFFAAGASPFYQIQETSYAIGWAPKFVVGGTWQGIAVGMRNSLVLTVWSDMFSLEAGHQWLHVEGKDQHEARIVLGVDLLRWIVAWGGDRGLLAP